MEALAVKYRPKTFQDVIGQDIIVNILSAQIKQEAIKNSYLFCGASGCGKTTIARIFAHEINKYRDASGNWCSSEPIEIDGASNNGVDNVKNIIRTASERSLDGKYKIFIIDECHALTSQAWQAFLKCIEEPPQFTIFIFCTTDPQKIPATILNRVMRFNFNKISAEKIRLRLESICWNEQLENFLESCDYISRICNGGMRDAIALLDKCASYSKDVNINNVLEALGNFSYDTLFDLTNSIIDGDEKKALAIIEGVNYQGKDLKLFVEQFLDFCLDITKYSIYGACEVTKFPITLEDKLKSMINFDNATNYYNYIVDKLLDLKNMLKNDSNPKSTIEVKILGMCRCN